ncbi:DNA-3-methyladenine glycosylase [Tetragenococcus halophilus]|uniref:Putative 3-methyladenine DNA glycosylase n=3 Tax=Tetragenococcus halophilus TaxID=51669 RepID=A0A2H6DQ96_TETHA|nr:DNA-3-methyladenine glycosylase [Tetragenococcus halophilus]AOF49637.1 3-methyladenine DNA glycosylase [Tetragenococcus halophilus]AYW51362.1 DNA-3-methyladenine glycosylase [Tetragenococcus halophilus]MCO7026809.1 DNA-3-methyladenine glycosylase [Tetragenococcus halophilus]MCO8285168.1 DNA-3-methyladenine glycosylase [Tetragenococcus halophilus]MCO8296403.1 DNA-3-methyladenine glycosylase [Tetragenococcus halophilus]
MKETIKIFETASTVDIARFLVGMYLEHDTPKGKLGGYIVDCEAYLGPDDMAAHSYGMRKTPRLKAMYQKPGTIYLYTMHTHLILNMVTQAEGMPQGVMIRAIEPVEGKEQMEKRRAKIGREVSNGPGKLVEALGIPKNLYGQSIFSSDLHLVPEKRKTPKKIAELPRVGIPNKGEWTDMPLRFVASGNPYITKIRRQQIDSDSGWQEENDND